MKLGRNDPCHCGSGKKYKHCHYEADRAAETEALRAAVEARAAEAQAAAESDEATDEGDARRERPGGGGSRFMGPARGGKARSSGPGGAPRVHRGAQRGG